MIERLIKTDCFVISQKLAQELLFNGKEKKIEKWIIGKAPFSLVTIRWTTDADPKTRKNDLWSKTMRTIKKIEKNQFEKNWKWRFKKTQVNVIYEEKQKKKVKLNHSIKTKENFTFKCK